MFTFKKIESLTEINFDELARSSLPYLDHNSYPWGESDITDDDKVATLRRNAIRIRDVGVMLDRDLTFTLSRDGYLLGLFVGQGEDGVYHGGLALFRDDENGSRAWAVDPDLFANAPAFLAEHGLHSWKSALPIGSRLRDRLADNWSVGEGQLRVSSVNTVDIRFIVKDGVLQLGGQG